MSAAIRPSMNREAIALASGARTTTQTVSVINEHCSSLIVTLNTTVIGTGNITLSIVGNDIASSSTYTILAGAAVSTNTTNIYRVNPLLTASANSIAKDIMPYRFNIIVTANNANPATYSVGYQLVK